MTDEERQKLCADLRRCQSSWLEDAADEIERLAGQLQTTLVMYGERNKEIERLAALAQSEAEPYYHKNINAKFEWPKGEYIPSFAQSDAEPQETWNKQPPGPDSILHELGECPDASAKSMLETAADLLEQLAHELLATNKRLEQLEARLEALERM
jgi:hypothetical protein